MQKHKFAYLGILIVLVYIAAYQVVKQILENQYGSDVENKSPDTSQTIQLVETTKQNPALAIFNPLVTGTPKDDTVNSTSDVAETKESNGVSKEYQVVNVSHTPNYLAAQVWFRIFEDDLAELTTKELIQWIEYLRFAGVTKIYLYDDCKHEKYDIECQFNAIKELGYLNCNLDKTNFCMQYFHARPKPDNSKIANELFLQLTESQANDDMQRQIAAFGDGLKQAQKNGDTWMMFFDMDEYPVIPNDTEKDFLIRFLKKYDDTNIAELSFPDCLILGYRWNKENKDKNGQITKDWLIEQVHSRDGCGTPLHKPINKVKHTTTVGHHHNGIASGFTKIDLAWKEARMHHYWAARLNDGYQSRKIPSNVKKNIAEQDYTVDPIVNYLKQAIIYPQSGYYKQHDSAEFFQMVKSKQRKLFR